MNPFDTRGIGLRGVMTEPYGALKVGVPIFVNDIAGMTYSAVILDQLAG